MLREPHTEWTSGAAEAAGVLGGTSFVAQAVLARLLTVRGRAPVPATTASTVAVDGFPPVFAFSRHAAPPATLAGVRWHRLPAGAPGIPAGSPALIPRWITVCPIWAVPEHFPLLEAAGARRLVALSSTSRFTKRGSAAAAERAIAARLAAAEDEVLDRSRAHGITATILRPTMTYDGVHDRNVAGIARFIRRVGFYPVAGAAAGLRQPIHADDVAAACLAVLASDGLRDAYDIPGGETLPYHEMVRRIFTWLGRRPRLASIPLPLVRAGLPLARRLPGLASMAAMADRMNEDLVFDHGVAARDFGFHPRPFSLPSRPDSNHAAGSPRPLRPT